MSEKAPISPTIPQALRQYVDSESRHIGNVQLTKLQKTGSTLHFVNDTSSDPELTEQSGEPAEQMIRHGEIPASSMAIWEFLDSGVANCFPEDVKQRLFGPWGKPQVAPLLDKEQHNRVYYDSHGKSSGYSKMVGDDTRVLLEQWNLTGVALKYFYLRDGQDPRSTRRSIDSTTSHLITDILDDIPELQGEKLRALVDEYWTEFATLNPGYGKDQELVREDHLMSDSISASLRLTEISHEIAAEIVRLYRSAHENPNLQWHGKPLDKVLLVLVHLQQAAAQQSELWWLGMSHGHLHPFNVVSRPAQPGSPEQQISPFITSVIDFDKIRMNAEKLAKNDELYNSINTSLVESRVRDPKLNRAIRLQQVFYLPINEWDDDVIDLISRSKGPVEQELGTLASLRAEKDCHDPASFTRVCEKLVYSTEKATVPPYYSYSPSILFVSLPKTFRMIKSQPQLVQPESPLALAAQFYATGRLPSGAELKALPKESKEVLLQALYGDSFRHANDGTRDGSSPGLDVLQFALEALDDSSISDSVAELISARQLISDWLLTELADKLHQGDPGAAAVARLLIRNGLYSNRVECRSFLSHAIDHGWLDKLLENIDLRKWDIPAQYRVYLKLRTAINTGSDSIEQKQKEVDLVKIEQAVDSSVVQLAYRLKHRQQKIAHE